MRTLLTALLLIVVTWTDAADNLLDKYILNRMDMRSGMPSNNVSDIFADSNGFVWVSTIGGGIARYDGYTFFSPMTYNMGFSPMSNSCLNMTEDKFKRLWISYEEGTDVVALSTMQKVTPRGDERLDSVLRMPSVRVLSDSKGAMWLVARAYIYYIEFDSEGNIARMLDMPYRSNTPSVRLRDVDGNGKVWAAIDGGLYEQWAENGRLVKREVDKMLQPLYGYYITDFMRRGNSTWVATDHGLFRLNNQTREMTHYTHSADVTSLSHDFVSCLALSDEGTLMAGTLGGVNFFSERDGSFEHWDTGTPGLPLSSDFVSNIMVANGQIWVGTETDGISKLMPRELLTHSYSNSGAEGSLSPNAVNAIYVEGNGTLWVGTVEGGLNRRAAGEQQFRHFTTSNSALTHNSVSMLEGDKYGRLWIGTWGGGVCSISTDNPQSVTPLQLDSTYARLTQHVGALKYDAINDALWIGSNDGVFLYNLKTQKMEEPFEGNRNTRGCIGAAIDREGYLWMGCITGARKIFLKRRDAKTGKFNCEYYFNRLDDPSSQMLEKISSFCETKSGDLWIGSSEYGLYKRERDNDGKDVFRRFTVQQGLANNSVKGIAEDKDGMLWVTTNNGLSKLNPQTGVITSYGESDGLLCQQFYWNSAVCSADGAVIYLGSTRGLIELLGMNVSKVKRNNLSFTRVTIDNQEVIADGRNLDEDITVARRLRLRAGDKTLNVEFSALNYGNERTGTYKCRLTGFENEWTQLQRGEHSVRYTNLPSGDYKLEVAYIADNGSPEDAVISLDISVSTYFWRTPWFWSAMILLLAVAGAYLYKRRIALLKKREERRLMEPIEKVFRESENPEELQTRIQDILHIQRRLKESSTKTADVDEQRTIANTRPFMEQVMKAMETNYNNSEFGVTELCGALGMSRTLLSRKLNAEVGVPASQFIRDYRLDIAKRLLQSKGSQRNIAEIAFSVGFNDPKYFTRCFTKKFGVSPSGVAGDEKDDIDNSDKTPYISSQDAGSDLEGSAYISEEQNDDE